MPKAKKKTTETKSSLTSVKTKPGTENSLEKKPFSSPAKPVSTEKKPITDKKPVSATTSAKVDRIKEVMQAGEFSMGELSKQLEWPFQKIRQTCRKIAKQKRKSLKSVSRGRWKLE